MLNPLEYLYVAVALIELYAELSGNATVRFFSKPLLMVVLMMFYARSIVGPVTSRHKLMMAAFFFSWIGDVALMFVPAHAGDISLMGLPKDPNFFLVGLVGFLITHILYSIAFSQVSDRSVKGLFPGRLWLFVPLGLYFAALMAMLIPALTAREEFRPFLIPVLVYSAAIAAMVVFAMNRYKRVNDASFALVFAGALLFMFSDSIIALSKFIRPFTLAGFVIMVLYITAQYLIAKGTLKQQ